MARSERLLDLLQLLRTYRRAVQAQTLARELGVSVRTIYRDIATLQAQGAPVEGEAGVGYLLRPGFTLPPLMFRVEELEALVLGIGWVADRPDAELAGAARHLLAKVRAVLPGPLAQELESTTLLVGRRGPGPAVDPGLAAGIRRAVRDEKKLTFDYADEAGRRTRRTVWPFGLGYFEDLLVVMAWCELRQDLRHFRADRISAWEVRAEGYPEPKSALLARWRASEGVPDRSR